MTNSHKKIHTMQGEGKETVVISQNYRVGISKHSLDVNSFCRRSLSWSWSIETVKAGLGAAFFPGEQTSGAFASMGSNLK
jgi:hypothetical protein